MEVATEEIPRVEPDVDASTDASADASPKELTDAEKDVKRADMTIRVTNEILNTLLKPFDKKFMSQTVDAFVAITHDYIEDPSSFPEDSFAISYLFWIIMSENKLNCYLSRGFLATYPAEDSEEVKAFRAKNKKKRKEALRRGEDPDADAVAASGASYPALYCRPHFWIEASYYEESTEDYIRLRFDWWTILNQLRAVRTGTLYPQTATLTDKQIGGIPSEDLSNPSTAAKTAEMEKWFQVLKTKRDIDISTVPSIWAACHKKYYEEMGKKKPSEGVSAKK